TAATAISAGSAPFTGAFRPENAFSTLTGNPNGTWTLKAFDDGSSSIGTLNNWSITMDCINGISYTWTSSPAGFSSSAQNPGSVSPTTNTTYTVTVTDAATGCATPASVLINVGQAPTVSNPSSASKCLGDTVTFSVTSTGTPAPTFQWKKNGTTIPGATASSYTINTIAPGDSGLYTVDAVNSCGSATSAAATLSITKYTIAASSGANGTVTPAGNSTEFCGSNKTYTITPSPCYQIASLSVNGSPVAIASSYTFTNIHADQTISATFSIASTDDGNACTSDACNSI